MAEELAIQNAMKGKYLAEEIRIKYEGQGRLFRHIKNEILESIEREWER